MSDTLLAIGLIIGQGAFFGLLLASGVDFGHEQIMRQISESEL